MTRPPTRVHVGLGLIVLTLALASAARASGEVVLSVSPVDVRGGAPLEVLLRTFIPFERLGTIAQPNPREPYPGPSGFFDVLYPWEDYPFDVVAHHEDGTDVPVTLARDPADSTLWRGVMSLPKAGTWTIWVRNFQDREPGSTAVVIVQAAASGSAQATASNSFDAAPAVLLGALLGLLVGLVLSRALHFTNARSAMTVMTEKPQVDMTESDASDGPAGRIRRAP